MKKTNSFEFTWKKTAIDNSSSSQSASSSSDQQLHFDDPELLATQAQKLFSLYRSRPRFGPESNEDCIRIASLLRPVEDLMPSDSVFSTKKQQSIRINQETLGGDKSTISASQQSILATTTVKKVPDKNFAKDVDKFEVYERDLSNLSKSSQSDANSKATKLASYATQTKPIGSDQPIIYSIRM